MVKILYYRPKIYWVTLNLIMIFLMVSIGGITRLTDSGLSMTEWSLIGGIIPPLTVNDWIETFDKYKLSPEFIYKNYDMTLSEFKRIFFWEYFHRIWGRLIGLTYFLPLLYFWITKKFSNFEKLFFLGLLILGSMQAFMGWFMVKSGLVENPDVSHFRLSAHLIIAFVIYSLMLFFLWTNLALARRSFRMSNENPLKVTDKRTDRLNIFLLLFSISILLVTIMSGAFVAGTKAGWAYNNFPLMGDNILPPVLINHDYSGFKDLLNDLGFIQFFHRILASTTLLLLILVGFYFINKGTTSLITGLSKLLLISISAQYLLGVLILKYYVPISLGVTHQLGSLVVITILTVMLSEEICSGAKNSSLKQI